MICYVLLFIFLLISTYLDVKIKKINIYLCILWGVLGTVINLMLVNKGIRFYLFGLAIGILILIFSFCTKEAIGKGDAAVFIVIGTYAGLTRTFVIFIISLILVLLIGSSLLLLKKVNKKTRLPFLPFILLAFIFSFII